MNRVKDAGPLLILDDRADVRAGLRRFFGLFFERVLLAATPEETEALLAAEKPPFLLCDYWLGNDHPPSTELIPRWRREHACVRVAALMTGTKASSIEVGDGVDAVFQKPLDLATVRDYLLSFA